LSANFSQVNPSQISPKEKTRETPSSLPGYSSQSSEQEKRWEHTFPEGIAPANIRASAAQG
jgi:hypothetical protein